MAQKNNILTELRRQLPDLLINESLAKYCTFHIGGPADFFYKLKDVDTLPLIFEMCKTSNLPIFVFGAGSNILFDDKGFRGLVIKLEADQITHKGAQITAQAGALVSKLVNYSIEHNFTGLEPWIGLPGTVGGAVRGNAGCNGLEAKDIFSHTLLFDPISGEIFHGNKKYLHFDYRFSKLKITNEIVLNATFSLKTRHFPQEKQKHMLDEFRKARHLKQPSGLTTGSFFKNPPKTYAGQLLEQAGLKGKTIGGAKISDKHANFFFNTGKATSKDVIKLARLARNTVKRKFNIELHEEVQIISEKGLVRL